jgi:small GTP-binding protein
VKIQLWDTAGQERFRGVTKSYYKGSHAVVLVCDATNPKSFDDVLSHWLKESRLYQEPTRIFCFINKCDEGEETPLP